MCVFSLYGLNQGRSQERLTLHKSFESYRENGSKFLVMYPDPPGYTPGLNTTT
jgi:hypothetical protein